MKKIAISLMLFLLVPVGAFAFNADDLLATIAMPLAVNAVANVNGVPQSRLADLVSTLNQANVRPTQFVEVIRYVPPALAPNTQSDFLQFVRDQVSQGNTGQTLVDAIVQQLRNNYNVQPQLALSAPPTTIVVQDNYIPADVVVTRVTTLAPAYSTSNDLLSLIGVPLAVAAVSNLTGVSQDSLANLLITLNQANVPPAQEIQVIRYVPVALVVDNGQTFVQYVQQQVAQGITGPALVPVVVQELRTYYPQPAQIVVTAPATPAPQAVIVDQNFVPPMVVTRVEEVRTHPHGGAPGQIKKELGLQTGAEVVHVAKHGRQFTPTTQAAPVVVRTEEGRGKGHGKEHGGPPPMMSSTPAPVVQQAPPAAQPVPAANPPGKDHGAQKGDQGKGKGKEKGHGKD